MGPNYKFVKGAYWDFWDHHLPLTEASLAEGLVTRGFQMNVAKGDFFLTPSSAALNIRSGFWNYI